MRNRLQLDWSLSSAEDRSAFLQQYMTSDVFTKRPPTEEELETMANYLLWGQDSDGLNPDQRKEIQLPRKNQTWAAQNLESLDALLESPTFLENSISKLGTNTTKKMRQNLSRSQLQQLLSPDQLSLFEELWETIDRTELLINFFEVQKGKRTKPPREELLSRFSPAEQDELQKRATSLNQFKYLKLRHLLVELRRQQYTLLDSVRPQVLGFSEALPPSTFDEEKIFEADIPVLPLGLWEERIFRDFGEILPNSYTEKELKQISKIYWKKKEEAERLQRESNIFYFDFRDLEMVYQLFLGLEEFGDEEESFLSTNSKFLKTLWYYVRQADLSPIQEEILTLKIQRKKNQDIAAAINSKFGKSYTTNYISTIFRQKILPAINEAATYHERLIGSVFFEEEFKACTKCGRLLLRDPANFVRRSRAKDGLSNHCKRCDKEEREKKKGGIISVTES